MRSTMKSLGEYLNVDFIAVIEWRLGVDRNVKDGFA